MLTKTEYCEAIVQDAMLSFNIKERKDAHSYIYMSSCLAVALEFLGELDKSERAYSSERAGIITKYVETNEDGTFKDARFLTVRDMLKILPDELPSKDECS